MIMRQGAAQAVRRRFRSLDIYGALPLVYLGRSLVVAGALLASAKGAAASQPFTLATYAKLQHLDALQISPDGAFIIVGWFYMDPANHKPFVPPNMGTFGAFGLSGILAGAGLIFFAYIGFDAVSTAAQETKNPKRDMPVGIIGSLLVCTVLFIAYSFVLTGVVNYRELNVAAPLALALERIPHPLLATAMNLAVLAGLTSVILVMLLGQSRVFFAMSKDGLLPKVFSAVHPEREGWTLAQSLQCCASGTSNSMAMQPAPDVFCRIVLRLRTDCPGRGDDEYWDSVCFLHRLRRHRRDAAYASRARAPLHDTLGAISSARRSVLYVDEFIPCWGCTGD